MTGNRPQVGLACTAEIREQYIDDADLARLESFADFHWLEFNEETSWDAAPNASDLVREKFTGFAAGLDALIVCHGSPRVDGQIFDASTKLRLVGELEGDRFAQRIDVEAAIKRGVRAVDTTHGSSYPVSEWALGLMLVGLRNAGAHFRRIIAGDIWGSAEYSHAQSDVAQNEELTGKTVGLIGAGYIGRKLIELLKPFGVTILAHDPYISSELASSLGFTLTSLDKVMSVPDVVVCLVPLTPSTKGMLGQREISLIKPGAVFVNVSRGAVVDTEALIERLEVGDITACLDVFDPEPMPADSRIRELRNVFLTPHIAGTTQRSRTRFFEEMVSELERHFNGHETQHNLTASTLANRRGE
jgi:phosphoglycerate dehydrogenase-like enzyme